MRFPSELYQVTALIAQHLPMLRPAHQRGLALWVTGTILAQSACQNAVITALLLFGEWHTVRQHLREWLYDGADKAAPCQTQVDVARCFAPLLRWVVQWWQSPCLALAVDATAHGEQVVALVVSVSWLRHSRGVAHSAGQPSGGLDVADLARAAPVAPGSPSRVHSAGVGRPRVVESALVETHW